MSKYVTHQFAHLETLDRAQRWLLQRGFAPGQIETHRDGVPWISVVASPEQSAEAELIFKAAEVTDPDGWPSFWELARMPHPHIEPVAADATATSIVSAGRSPVGWHPLETAGAPDDAVSTEVWDVSTRFG
jgi:hypothetical protein